MAAYRLDLSMLSYAALKTNKQVMSILSMFATFFKYLKYSKDLVYCGPFPAITTLVTANDCRYRGHKPIKQNGDDLISNT
jgi:hypothetical protein